MYNKLIIDLVKKVEKVFKMNKANSSHCAGQKISSAYY